MLRSAWYKEQKKEKRNQDEGRDYEHCYARLLRENISSTIDAVKEKFEKETLYKIQIRRNFSSIEVLVNQASWKSEKLFDLHFKLKAWPHGIFLMYGAFFKAQSNSFLVTPSALYSVPERVNRNVQDSTIEEWIKDTTNISVQSLQLTEIEAENAIKNSAKGSGIKHRWRILFCRRFRRFLRFSGFL